MRTFLFLALLFVTSYCVDNTANKYDEVIDELVTLNSELNAPPKAVQKMLGQISQSATNSRIAFNKFYSVVKANCAIGTKTLKNFVSSLNADSLQYQNGMNKAAKRIKRNTASAKKHAKSLAREKAALAKAHVRHTKSVARFRKAMAEAQQKQIVIKHVRNIVVDELLNGPTPQPSLIQVQTINTKLNELKSMVDNDNDSYFKMVVGTLIGMATEQNLNDQKILKKFLKALAKLANKIARWIKKSSRAHKNLVKLFKKSSQSRMKAIRAASRLLVEARSMVAALKREIAESKNAIAVIGRALIRKNKERASWAKLCADQARVSGIFQKGHANLMKALNR